MYIAGRFRTASRPSRIVMEEESYFLSDVILAVAKLFSLTQINTVAGNVALVWDALSDYFLG